ncbi:unnamed protein product [Didymodactylos carnosus]|uniref:Uncharacterized protein n=1 Tax=Didymodactylos carnosus TaxID=1234261 RepID=A0A814B466_9BILA|nr:unnamed protein product [Didymodactylos carnosus]CAF0922511.1 unnamed protein product [Didymodactylos carnosus]CAF3658188.1 unnamed protein product [Didymodactylos carnosus]CAF3701640.1 unnamed protein product [Didymodactylos carnosus]
MLKILCALVSQTIDDQLIQLQTTTLFSESVQPDNTILANAEAIREQFVNTISNSFSAALNTIRTVLKGNQIVNRLKTNYQLATPSISSSVTQLSHTIQYLSVNDNCTCSLSSCCKATTGVYNTSAYIAACKYEYTPSCNSVIDGEIEFDVPRISIGCLVLDAVLQSDLSCFYNESCLSELKFQLTDLPSPLNTTLLKVGSSVASLPTIGELIANLMVEEWYFNSSYESYFDRCSPQTCKLPIPTLNNLISSI